MQNSTGGTSAPPLPRLAEPRLGRPRDEDADRVAPRPSPSCLGLPLLLLSTAPATPAPAPRAPASDCGLPPSAPPGSPPAAAPSPALPCGATCEPSNPVSAKPSFSMDVNPSHRVEPWKQKEKQKQRETFSSVR
ncbi:translation initiation factor IF-2-like [Eucalyptus grandis]|uniref:translation initiation factor IF-2-like n=1 Tax=Eucalyptus grandis TaxID=71139 RepID=UPI00192E7DCE|nr:translation initiation factor IF-2-like [Eucalyptus grandis]